MLLQMRAMIEQGMIGDIRVVDLQYTHGFCATDEGEKISAAQKWRVDLRSPGQALCWAIYLPTRIICHSLLCQR